jgi:hypothetical protein
MFHALRIKPALRLVNETPPAAVIQSHLDAIGDS